ncbi:MAG: archaellin/type IV pilin N-terminal domain-containing protein [Candidatus Nezhaarchaeales archaeon]
MVGIEAAIVLIAFVLVASALAFVVLNMGMFTTQKTKEVIARAYEESTRAIDIAGNVKAKVDRNDRVLDLVAIPIKLTAGARPIDLNKTAVAITVILPDGTAHHTDNGYTYIEGTTFTVVKDFGKVEGLDGALDATWVYVRSEDADVSKEGDEGDELLEPGEIVLLVFKAPEGTGAYSRIIVEIKPPQGSTVTIERIVPPKLDSDYVDLDIG